MIWLALMVSVVWPRNWSAKEIQTQAGQGPRTAQSMPRERSRS
jgi:hypothetical protein